MLTSCISSEILSKIGLFRPFMTISRSLLETKQVKGVMASFRSFVPEFRDSVESTWVPMIISIARQRSSLVQFCSCLSSNGFLLLAVAVLSVLLFVLWKLLDLEDWKGCFLMIFLSHNLWIINSERAYSWCFRHFEIIKDIIISWYVWSFALAVFNPFDLLLAFTVR